MPLTPFRREVLAVLVGNRSESSHFAGGLVLNAPDDTARYSHDFDMFHEAAVDVERHSNVDVEALITAGYEVEKVSRASEWEGPAGFRKAIVRRNGERLELDWAHDSAFRFFPVVPDPLLGWRLHLFDMATNKALALSARMETRDYVDIVELGGRYPLEAIVWAACGKDPGFSPLFLLKMMRRFARIDPTELDKIQARALDPIDLKKQWIAMSDHAEAEITRIADTQIDLPIGVAFLDDQGEPGWIGQDATLQIHAPTLRGCWPELRFVEDS